MPYSTSGLNSAADGVAAVAEYISAHTANPGSGGTSEVTGGTYARQQTTWGAASNGSRVGTEVSIPVPGGTTVTYWGLWTAVSGGTFKGAWALSEPEVFSADGTLDHTPTITAVAGN